MRSPEIRTEDAGPANARADLRPGTSTIRERRRCSPAGAAVAQGASTKRTAWYQAVVGRLGGRSRREARGVGERGEEGGGSSRPTVSGEKPPRVATAAGLPSGPVEGEGSPGWPHGAAHRQGLSATEARL